MSSELSLALSYQGQRLRFVGTPDCPAWVASDVCDILGIENPRSSMAKFDDDEKGVHSVDTLSGKQSVAIVYESGLYRLIFKSRKEEAKKFQNWVFRDVLPSIRKFGVYPPPEHPEEAKQSITLKPYTARAIQSLRVRGHLPEGYWCVFVESSELLIGLEHIFAPANLEMSQYDLVDGSIGTHWARFREGKSWAGTSDRYSYTFPDDDPRGTVTPLCYPMKELEHFKVWLHNEYWTTHFPDYVKRKYGTKQYTKALPIFADLGIGKGIKNKQQLALAS